CSGSGWSMRRGRWGVGAWVSGGVVLLLALVMVAPFLYIVATSLMGGLEALRSPPAVLPGSPRWANYAEALTAMPFGRFFVNSAIFAGCVVVGDFLAGDAASEQAGAGDACGRRLRGPMEELPVAARRHALARDERRRGGRRAVSRVLRNELAVPDGGRSDGGRSVGDRF